MAIAKILGMAALLVPTVPRIIKEWAYVGFAITFISGSIAHGLIDGFGKGAAPLISLTALVVSYYYFRKLKHKQILKPRPNTFCQMANDSIFY